MRLAVLIAATGAPAFALAASAGKGDILVEVVVLNYGKAVPGARLAWSVGNVQPGMDCRLVGEQNPATDSRGTAQLAIHCNSDAAVEGAIKRTPLIVTVTVTNGSAAAFFDFFPTDRLGISRRLTVRAEEKPEDRRARLQKELGARVAVAASSDALSATELNWGRKETTDATMAQLKNYKNLRTLKLWDANITDKGLEHVRELPELNALYLGNTQITDAGLLHLSDLKNIETLSLANERGISDAGLAHIGKMTNLKNLVLNGTDISDKGLVHLKDLTDLHTLNLSFTPITEDGLRYAVAHFPHLKYFYHADTGKPSAVHEKLRQIYECSGEGQYNEVNVKVVKPLLTGKTPAEYAERWFGKIGLTTSLTSICHLLPEPGLYSHAISYQRRRRGEHPLNLDVMIDTKMMTGKLSFKQWDGYLPIGNPKTTIKTNLHCKSTDILEPMYLPYSPQ